LHKNRRSDNLKEYKAATNFYQWLEHKLDEAAVGLIAITSGQRFFLEYTRFVRFKERIYIFISINKAGL